MSELVTPLGLIFATVVGVLGTARLTRLVVDDSYPPAAWLRDRWRRLTRDGPWAELVDCAFCAAPYIAAPNLAWAVLSDLHWSWWLVNGWLAAAYSASMIVVRDTPE